MEDAKLIALHEQLKNAGPKGGRGGLGAGASRKGQPYNFAGAKAYGESEIQTGGYVPKIPTPDSSSSNNSGSSAS